MYLNSELREELLKLLDYMQPSEEADAARHEKEYGDLDGHIIVPIRRLREELERQDGGYPVVDYEGETAVFERTEDAQAFADALNKRDGTDGYEVEYQWAEQWPPEDTHDANSTADLIASI